MSTARRTQNQPIGATVKGMREAAELTLSDLATASGVDASHLSRVESGARGIGPDRLHRIATAIARRIGGHK